MGVDDTGSPRVAVQQACSQLGLSASDNAVDSLLEYLRLLRRWGAVYNLTGIREPSAMLSQHLMDCLAIIPALRRVLDGASYNGASERRVLDVGSGGGLPGVVLAIMCPTWRVVCVDTVGKKVAFIRQVSAELMLKNLSAEHGRVEDLSAGEFDLVISRAFASLPDFTALTRRHLASDGMWAAMKGRVPDDEIAMLPSTIEVFHVEQLSVPGMDAQRCLVWMRPQKKGS